MSPETSRIPRIAIAVGAAVVVFVGVGGLLALNGGDDDGGPDGNGRRSTTTETTATTTTTEPAAVGEGEQRAFSIVEERVIEATDLTDRLLQNPQVVNDPTNPDVARLPELYTDDSPTPASVMSRLTGLASAGQSMRAGPSGVFRDFLVRRVAAVDENTVRFEFCSAEDQETVDGTGTVVEHFVELTQGNGEMRRIDGQWLFFGLHRDENTSFPIDPTGLSAGACARLYPDEGTTS